jgi:asparagine synthetase B (glutamine-hydrolysing)
MAGLIIIHAKRIKLASDVRVQDCLTWCRDFGCVDHILNPDILGVTWRREKGEFPHSGTISSSSSHRSLLWLGQVLDDSGDISSSVIQRELVAKSPFENPCQLNGAFIGISIDYETSEITVCNDRYGHYGIYYYEDENFRVLSTRMELIFPWMSSRAINQESLNFFIRSGEMVDDMTLVSGIRFLHGGIVSRFSREASESRRWWSMHSEIDDSIDFNSAAKECGHRLKTAVQRIALANPSIGVPLSGGLDSRFLLAMCPEPNRVPSFTMGLKGCRDVRFAEEFAEKIKSPHDTFIWQPELFPPLWNDGVATTGGAFGITEMHMLPYAEKFSEKCGVTLNGLAGDALLGGNFIKRKWMRTRSTHELAEMTWNWRSGEPLNDTVDLLLRKNGDRTAAINIWKTSLYNQAGHSPYTCLFDWLVRNRVFRFTNCGTSLLRRHVESHAPFFDNDFFEFLSRIPFSYRYKHRLYLHTLNQTSYLAASVPWQRTGIRPSRGYLLQLMALLINKFAGVSNKKFHTSFLSDMRVSDVQRWLSHGLWKEKAYGILMSDQTADRGWFSRDVIRDILSLHDQGNDQSSLLGRAITVELLCRQLERFNS